MGPLAQIVAAARYRIDRQGREKEASLRLRALQAEARAREEEVQVATAGKRPRVGGDLQGMRAHAKIPKSGGWAGIIEANRGGGPPRCPVCNKVTRSQTVCGIVDHMKALHSTEFRSSPVSLINSARSSTTAE